MKLFTVGPVEMTEEILRRGGEQLPYFRTEDFSQVMRGIRERFLALLDAPEGSEFVALTAAGTGAMEAAVVNVLDERDRCLIIDGGSFGHRFAEICALHGIPHTCISLPFGEALTKEHLSPFEGGDITALLVNIDETSTAQLYDYRMLGDFCQRNGCLYIADAVSTFLADEFSLAEGGVDASITSSQKALALPPGLSFVSLSPRVQKERIGRVPKRSYYFDFEDHLKNMERGQTPFTPAVGILLQLQLRLEEIKSAAEEIRRHRERAEHFRALCPAAGLTLPDYPMSNAVTALLFPEGNAQEVFETMKTRFGKMLTPSGGLLRDRLLRVGHIGALEIGDLTELAEELRQVILR